MEKGLTASTFIHRKEGENDYSSPKATALISEDSVAHVELFGKYTYEQFNELIALAKKFQIENRGE